ncbi:MAG: protein kinase [Acidobacteriota bacterium]
MSDDTAKRHTREWQGERPQPPPRLSLTFGDRVVDRYEVRRFIARGSVGEIYEAFDTALRQPVALKIIAPRAAGDSRIESRFRREILLSRQVSHPNVCRIFDLGVHRDRRRDRELLFLTMELLEGESLAERLSRVRKLSTDDALPIAQQMAAGLSAAHVAGVIHRDFKSSNVLLAEHGQRAVVVDFGLARSLVPEHRTETIVTREGMVVGTPAYMAPEQVTGRELTASTDIYSYGIVLFEMVTGRLPFAGIRPLEVASRRLKEPAPDPRTLVPELDPRWAAVILRCLERDPRDRFATAVDAATALTDDRLPPTVRGKHRRQRRLWLIAASLVALAVLVGMTLFRTGTGTEDVPTSSVSIETRAEILIERVVLLGFHNLSGDPALDWIGDSLTAGLPAELEEVTWVSGEPVARERQRLAMTVAELPARETIDTLLRHLDAEAVVHGSYLTQATDGEVEIKVVLRLWREGAATSSTLSADGSESEIFDLIDRTGAKLADRLSAR